MNTTYVAWMVTMASLLVGAPAASAQTAGSAAQRCDTLQMMSVAPSTIALPTKGARIVSAKLIGAAPQTKDAAGRVTLARPEYCEVKGEIAPADAAAPPIRFQVNLPTDWNGKAVHMGGGGYDGNVATAIGAAPRAPDTAPYAITRGFATFGSDSGHEGNDASFALNDEALANFAYAQLKKTRDTAMALVQARYGRIPARTYFIGQSEGGREGLTVAQRFPRDYDGVVVTAPAIHFTQIMLRFNDISTALAKPGGFLPPANVAAFGNALLAQCDMNDGVADGVVGNYLGCTFDTRALRCGAEGAAADGCFSDSQIATLNAIYGAKTWKDASGKISLTYPRYLVGGGESLPSGLQQWITGRAPLPRPQPAGKAMNGQQLGLGTGAFYGNSAVRYLIVKDPAFDTLDFDPRAYAERVAAMVKLLDSADPNLRAFQTRGGKLIMLHNTADLAVSPVATMDYYDALVNTLGADTVRQFARLYIVPAGDHGGGNAPSKVDLLAMIDRWVVNGDAPGETAVAEEYGADMHVTRSKPLCAYPNYPRYVGSGDKNAAGSYRCTAVK
jgi:feruloyl esterase